jgi:diguanylate cyclase (GGDEF)-like protein
MNDDWEDFVHDLCGDLAVETMSFELCAQSLMAEWRTAEKNVEARRAQGFFRTMLGLYLDQEQSYLLWQEILLRWEKAKAREDSIPTFREVLISYLLGSRHFNEPIITEFNEFQRLRFSSTTDHLTKLGNRRFFDAVFVKEIPRAARYGEDLSLILIDLNRFKEINDTFGHAFGDEILVLTAKILNEMMRISDSAFRIGGDEFALLLPQTSQMGASTLAERIGQRFAEEVKGLRHTEITASLAYGIASCPREATDGKALFELADQRLYECKRRIGSPRCFPRRHKRISTEELGAYVVLRAEDITREGQLIDFSFGGIGLRLEGEVHLPDTMVGDLHLRVLPSSSVMLRKVYARSGDGGQRIGCAFLEPRVPMIASPT